MKAGRDFFVHFQDGNALPAKLVGYDLFDDIAVLKIDPTRAAADGAPVRHARATSRSAIRWR